MSAQAAKRYNAAPIGFDESGKRLLVAMIDPSNVLALDDLKLMTGHPITRVVAAPEDLATVIASQPVPGPTVGHRSACRATPSRRRRRTRSARGRTPRPP